MKSGGAVVSMVAVAALLVFCSDDEEQGAVGDYKLQLDGISENVTIGTQLDVSAQIVADGKTVGEGDAAVATVLLVIKCGEHEIDKQEKKAAKGKVNFDTIKVEGENFDGSCTATLSAKIAGQDVSDTLEFEVGIEAMIALPEPDQNQDGDELPTARTQAVVGQAFSIVSKVDLKVQPDELCNRKLTLIYYDAKKNTVREVLTAGEVIKPVKGRISGLAVVKLDASVKLSECVDKQGGSKNTQGSDPTSITVAVSPGFAKGLKINLIEATTVPQLAGASLSGQGGKIKLDWSKAENFTSQGAQVFFNSVTEGNEWSRYSGDDITWGASAGESVSVLAYDLPVKALVKVNLDDRGAAHWLYFYKK